MSPMTENLDHRPSYLAAAIAAGLTFLLYVATLAPETAMWDTSEYIAAAYTLGLPHPPGNPFFVLIGRVFSILPIAPNVAMRINLLAAVSSAVSAGMWFLITERVLVGWFDKRWQRIVGGSLAVLIGATAFTVWSQSVVNEKVYTVSLVGMAICAWLTVRWCDEPDAPKADRLLVLVAYLCGLGYANHMAGVLVLPAVGIAVLLRKPKIITKWKLLLACAGALVLGATPFATQPIRSAHFPAVNEGETTACRTELRLDCTLTKETWDAWKYNFDRGQYAKLPVTTRQAPFHAQVGMWWLYFKWQWIRDHQGEHSGLQGGLAATFLLLGFIGGWVHWKRDRRSFAFFGPLMLTLTLGLIYYLNFKYGASQSPELGDTVDREVRDRDYFYLWSFSAWSVWAALGLVYVWESVAVVIGRERVKVGTEIFELPTLKGWLIVSPFILLLAGTPLYANWSAASRAGDTSTADFAIDMLNSVEPYGILVTVGDNDTFPLWYAQEVLGVRRDVTVANTSLMNTEWYTRQLIRRPVFEYDAAAGPSAYRDREWPKPTEPVLKMSLDDADRVPVFQEIATTQVFVKGDLRATITPRVIDRASIFVLRMILDNDIRKVHLSRTSAGLGDELGLRPYLVTQGHSRRVMPSAVTPSSTIVQVPGEGFVDAATTHSLWREFRAPAALIKKGIWVDEPSRSIPFLIMNTGIVNAEALARTGQRAQSDSVLATARQVGIAIGLGDIFAGQEPQPQPILPADTAVRTPVPGRRP
jgi:hypothetical protein